MVNLAGTEANNAALAGVFVNHKKASRPHFIIRIVEHPSVANTAKFLERVGAAVTRVPVDHFGMVAPDAVAAAIQPDTVLISVMHANNEVGTIQPIKEICAIACQCDVLVHTDAAQSTGKIAVDLADLGVDLLRIAGHKMYAPQGVGALFIRHGVQLEPWLHGAAHEGGRRAAQKTSWTSADWERPASWLLAGLTIRQFATSAMVSGPDCKSSSAIALFSMVTRSGACQTH